MKTGENDNKKEGGKGKRRVEKSLARGNPLIKLVESMMDTVAIYCMR